MGFTFKIWVDIKCLCQVTTNMVYTASQPKKHSEPLNQGTQLSAHSDQNIRSRGIIRNSLSGKENDFMYMVILCLMFRFMWHFFNDEILQMQFIWER